MTEREDYLRAYVPAELQQRLAEAAGRLRGERRTVSVLFADTVGSTALGRALDPDTYQSLMSRILGTMVEAVAEFEGMVARLQGDGLLAFFGAPLAHEDDAERAVRAGLRLLENVRRLAEEVREAFAVEIQARVAVTTGSVIVGEVGSPLRLEYTAIGDSVNLAARLQAAAAPGKLLASQKTWRLVEPLFEAEALAPMTIKGMPEPVTVVRILRARPEAGKMRGLEGHESPLVGREEELERLRQALGRLRDGLGQVVALTGEAGIGKSRLVEELRADPGDVLWIEGRCLSYGETVAYLPFADLLRDWLGVTPSDPPLKTATLLDGRIRRLFGPRAHEIYPYLASLLALPLEPEVRRRLADMAPESLKHRHSEVLHALLERLTHDQPLVVVFDDLHWADPTSLEMLGELLPATDAWPIIIVLLFREERDKGCWELLSRAQRDLPHRLTAISLPPLPDAASRQLVEALGKAAAIPASLLDLLLERAEGNPFFLEELIRSLVEGGRLQPDDDPRRLAEPGSVPETIESVLQARLDRLPSTSRQALQAASVIGRLFTLPLLQRVAQLDGQLEPSLAELQRLQLVVERRRFPVREFRFRHVLVQQVAYRTLLDKARRALHGGVARALEELHEDRLEEQYGLLGYHYAEAGEDALAMRYLKLAGDRARIAYAGEEALGHYDRLLTVQQRMGDAEGVFRTRLKIGLVHLLGGRYPLAQAAYDQAFTGMPEEPLAPLPLTEHLTIYVGQRPAEMLDPHRTVDTSSWALMDRVFAGLVEGDEERNVVPALGERWTVSQDGLRYTFVLRSGARWSDGRPLTAEDVVSSFRRELRLNRQDGHPLEALEGARAFRAGHTDALGVRAVDDRTVELRLARPRPSLLPLLWRRIIPVGVDEALWRRPGAPPASGPWMVRAWEDVHAELVPNPHHARPRRGNVGRVTILFRSGPPGARPPLDRVDLVEEERQSAEFLEAVRQAGEALAWSARRIPRDTTGIAMIHSDRPPFDQQAARRAIDLALDRTELARTGVGAPADGGYLAPGMPGHSPHLDRLHDPERARGLLEAAGGLDRPLVVAVVAQSAMSPAAPPLKRQLEAGLGIEVEVRELASWQAFNAAADAAEADVFLIAWTQSPVDPAEQSLVFDKRGTGQAWDWAGFQSLLERARDIADVAEGLGLVREADRLLVEREAVILPLVYDSMHVLVGPHVRNWAPGRLTHDLIIERR